MTPEPVPVDPASGASMVRWIEELDSDDVSIRRAARRALVEAGGPAVAMLVECLGDGRDRVRWEAAKALAAIGDPVAAPALVAALEDENDGVRWLAAEGLIAVHREALPSLLDALAHRPDSPWLRHGAHHVIRALPVWRLVEALTPVLGALEHSGSETTVPVAARSALETVQALLGGRTAGPS
jgi:HEAT repeat protein